MKNIFSLLLLKMLLKRVTNFSNRYKLGYVLFYANRSDLGFGPVITVKGNKTSLLYDEVHTSRILGEGLKDYTIKTYLFGLSGNNIIMLYYNNDNYIILKEEKNHNYKIGGNRINS